MWSHNKTHSFVSLDYPQLTAARVTRVWLEEMPGIDYSKWDKIDCSSSSSSEDEEENDVGIKGSGGSQPRVTRLDAPSRITRTADGNLVVEKTQKPFSPRQQQPSNNPTISNETTASEASTTTRPANVNALQQQKIEVWTENGARLIVPQNDLELYWGQDRYSITIRLALPLSRNVKGKDLHVRLTGAYRYSERFSAVGSNDRVASLVVEWKNPVTSVVETLLQGDFPHPIHTPEDCDMEEDDQDGGDGTELDWTLDRVTERNGKSNTGQEKVYWCMTIFKAVPMEGVVIWWRRPLTIFEEISATEANPNAGIDGGDKAEAFQNAWEEAHRQFREKVQSKKAVVDEQYCQQH